MAGFNPVIARSNGMFKIPFGDKSLCFVTMTFTGSDTYLTAAASKLAFTAAVTTAIKRKFAVGDVEAMHFGNGGSDGSVTAGSTGEAAPRFDYPTQTITFFKIGRNNNSSVDVGATETVNNEPIAAMRFDFVAICSGAGSSAP